MTPIDKKGVITEHNASDLTDLKEKALGPS